MALQERHCCPAGAGHAVLDVIMFPALTAETKPPVAPVHPKVLENQGDRRTDNYFWFREKADPDVIAYLEAENRYTELEMKATEKIQSTLYEEIVARIQEDDTSAPVRRGNFEYYTRTKKGLQYPDGAAAQARRVPSRFCCCTATAAMAFRRSPPSAPSGCRYWTGASSMPSPTFAAAPAWAKPGTTQQDGEQAQYVHGLHRRR